MVPIAGMLLTAFTHPSKKTQPGAEQVKGAKGGRNVDRIKEPGADRDDLRREKPVEDYWW